MMDETLPERWALVKIEDIADVVEPGFPYGKYNTEGIGIPHLRPMNINGQGNLSFDEIKYVNVDNPPLLHKGDILFNNTNSPVWVGKTTVVTQGEEYTFSNHMTRLTLNSFAGEPQFFALQLQYMQRLGYFLERCIHHVNQASISSSFLAKNVDILVAPTNEQHRIVAAIEQQFTRLDNAVASLRSAQAKAKQYRASLLKAAVEGELTKAWRAEHPAEETGEQLLTRILAERRARWEEAELAKMREQGITPRDSKWKERYEEPQRPDVEQLPELSEGWCWATVEQICDQIADCLHSTPKFKEKGFLCIDTNCIKPGKIILEKARYVDENTFIERNRRMKPQRNDVVFSREGALLGIAVKIPEELDFCLGQRMMIFRPHQSIDASYYESVLNSAVFRAQYQGKITGTASPHLNIEDIKGLAIPITSIQEQSAIVFEVEQNLSVTDAQEENIENSLRKAEHDRQSILQEAFAGRLVPQDPDDEPASVLLERIREERKRREEQEKVVRVDRKGVHMEAAKRRRSRKTEGDQQGGRLYETLVEAGQPLSPDELFKRVGLSADEQSESAETFYEELQDDEAEKLIKEHKTDDLVLLEALPSEQEELAEAAEVEQDGQKEQNGKKVEKPMLWDMNDQ